MIRANTRGRLTAADLQLVILLLSRGSAHRRAYLERRLATEGPDPLLDAPDLLERLWLTAVQAKPEAQHVPRALVHLVEQDEHLAQ